MKLASSSVKVFKNLKRSFYCGNEPRYTVQPQAEGIMRIQSVNMLARAPFLFQSSSKVDRYA